MKRNQLITTALLSLGLISAASAATVVTITGSTAVRNATYNVLITPGVVFTAAPVVASYGNAVNDKATYVEFQGTATAALGGGALTILTDWSGSEAGIQDVSGAGTENFLLPIGAGTPAIVAGVTAWGGASSSASSPVAAQLQALPVDIALADNALTFSQSPGSTASQLGPIAAVPFVFVRNNTPGNDAGVNASLSGGDTVANKFTNITDANFQNLANGGADIGLFIGYPKLGYNVYLAGRNNLSGTRANVFGITGFGINSFSKQIELTGVSGNNQLVNQETAYGNGYLSNSGQNSGGTLAGSLLDTSSSYDYIADANAVADSYQGFYVVSYLGLSDAGTAEAAPINAIQLNYNGAAYSANGVITGTYDLWGNEYILSKHADANGAAVASAVAAAFEAAASFPDAYEIPLLSLKVNRAGPTSNPTY